MTYYVMRTVDGYFYLLKIYMKIRFVGYTIIIQVKRSDNEYFEAFK